LISKKEDLGLLSKQADLGLLSKKRAVWRMQGKTFLLFLVLS